MWSNVAPIRSLLSGVALLLLGNGLLNTLPTLRGFAGSCSTGPLGPSRPGVRPVHSGQPRRPGPCARHCLRRSDSLGEPRAQFTPRLRTSHTGLEPMSEASESAVESIPEPTGPEHAREEACI